MGPANEEAGLTMLEVLVVMAILGLGLGIASLNLDPIATPLQAGSALLEGHFRQVRTRAISTTSACRARADGLTGAVTECASNCSASTWTAAAGLQMNLPDGVAFESSSWSACFTSRGISTQNQTIVLEHDDYGTTTVEVLLGGTTRVVG